jgi:SAM-dependent methyltransferase
MDPLAREKNTSRYRLVARSFEDRLDFNDASFDAVVMLATVEHIPRREPLVEEVGRVLRPEGLAILTVPAPFVDTLVSWMIRLRLADGMSLEEHEGLEPKEVHDLFIRAGFTLRHWSRFQLTLNHLMVFCSRP